MADTHNNQALGDLLIELSRNLLQYVGETSPWTATGSGEQSVIDDMVAKQQSGAERLVDLLNGRRFYIRFGTYPTDFTDLQYLALDHLLGQLVSSQRGLVETVGRTINDCAGDEGAIPLLRQILETEQDNLRRLEELAAKRSGSAA